MNTSILIYDNSKFQMSVKRDAVGYITEGIVIGDTCQQDQALLLMSHPGEWKENPIIGVGIQDFINDDSNVEELHYLIERQFKMCGFVINSLSGASASTTEIIAERND